MSNVKRSGAPVRRPQAGATKRARAGSVHPVDSLPARATNIRDVKGVTWHNPDRCNDIIDIMTDGIRPCVIHYPTKHRMRSWPINVRDDKDYLIERICEHGIGHPDPDSLYYFKSIGKGGYGVHGCDTCCSPATEESTIIPFDDVYPEWTI